MEELQTILGQEKQHNALMADLNNDRLAQSYLFYGPPGVGKKLTAVKFFKQINGHLKDCSCNFCNQVDICSHPDLIIIKPEGKFIKIEQVRKIQHFLSLIPINSKVKMAIIDNAHDLKIEAANALLKILEEPPKKSILILVTSIHERLLLTIKSRCRYLRFNAILKEDIEYYLKNVLRIEEQKADLAAKISGGIFGKALQICKDDDFWQNREEMIDLALKLLQMKADEAMDMAEKFIGKVKKQSKSLDKSKKSVASERTIKKLCDNLTIIQSVFRDAMILTETNDTSLVINSDCITDISDGLSKIDSIKLVGYINKIETAKKMLRQNVNTLLLIESLFLNIEHK